MSEFNNTNAQPRLYWSQSGAEIEADCACAAISTVPRVVVDHPRAMQLEDDCACAPAGPAPVIAEPDMACSTWQVAPGLHLDDRLPDGHTLAFNPTGSSGVVVLNTAALEQLHSFRAGQPLHTSLARQLAGLELLQPVDSAPTCPQVTPELLTAWLHVTNACNLRCTYCYVNKDNAAMDEATGLAAVEAVFRTAQQHGFKAVKLKYAGGEATLNFKLVQTLHRHAQQLSRQSGLTLEAVLLSNGVSLTPTMLTFLRAEGVRLMISLDSVDAGHDNQRVFANGQGSLALVLKGVERAVAHGVQPHLSVTVTAITAAGLPEVVDFARQHNLPFNLNFYRETAASTPEVAQAEDERLIIGVLAAFERLQANLPAYSLMNSMIDRSNFSGMHTHTCGVGHNYLVIDHQGRVARCHMALEQPLGNIFQHDPLLLTQAPTTGFQNLSVESKEGCRECEWRYYCAGGCSLLTYRTTGRSDVKSPYCRVYKAIYPELLRLEGLRLLQHNATF
jgi:uncharacterized protein